MDIKLFKPLLGCSYHSQINDKNDNNNKVCNESLYSPFRGYMRCVYIKVANSFMI